MGSKRAKIITKEAFTQAFVEAELVMRNRLAEMIQERADQVADNFTKSGLLMAKDIVLGVKND